ncbi:restriction endonuclease [Arthrobacter luteolus]|uniref:restriction endonuclease n=1 Tax=Arthrobacter luteolus TaxID=98672 RepID=UPI00137559AD|nr:restriction endonuclease [Arthrobacter luteolus]
MRQKVVQYIALSWPLDAAPQRLEEIIYQVAIDRFGTAEALAAEFAESHTGQAKTELTETLTLADQRALPCRFAFNEKSSGYLQGSSFIQVGDDESTRRAKERRLHYDSYEEFLKNLRWEEFEACCRGILDQLGCPAPKLTALSGDQGIDFFGQLSLRARLGNESVLPSVDSMLNVWMVGQAKHYQKTQVSTPDLRELVGSVQLARAKAFADGGVALRDLDMKVCDPVFYLFFTTGTISRDGYRLLDTSGMISMNGAQIAAFLADNGVGMIDGVFETATASAWINRYR